MHRMIPIMLSIRCRSRIKMTTFDNNTDIFEIFNLCIMNYYSLSMKIIEQRIEVRGKEIGERATNHHFFVSLTFLSSNSYKSVCA